MSQRAQVRSIEAIEAFRANLILYLSKARPALEEITSDLRRIWHWIQTDQRQHWEREVRRRARALDDAKQALFSAQVATLRGATSFEQAAVHKARQALSDAEDKLRRVKKWSREFGPRTEALTRQIGGLDSFLSHDMAKAVATLTDLVRTLEDYAARHGPGALPGSGTTGPRAASESSQGTRATPDQAGADERLARMESDPVRATAGGENLEVHQP
jgi:hypothetical protein